MRIVKTVLSLAVLLVAVAAKGAVVTLASETGEVTLQNGDVLTGAGGTETHVVIDAGATVTLRDVDITAVTNSNNWAGITCEGNATIVLQGDNVVKGGHEDNPGIFVPEGGTLTIQGDGALNVGSNGYGAGIGGGLYIPCGNIVIAGGTITAMGGDNFAAGIGSGQEAGCGSITISGGIVTAKGGQTAAGIGSGAYGTCGDISILGGTVIATGGRSVPENNIRAAPGIGSGGVGGCGNISISESVRCVTSNGGDGAPCGVGAGDNGSCGTVTVDGVVQTDGVTTSPYIYNPCITNITSAADWNAFASRVNRGIDAYDGLTVTLAADISVTNMVGIVSNPFSGTFEGGGHSLVVDISAGGAAGQTLKYLNVLILLH